jgi:S1-C subfamily serine protease
MPAMKPRAALYSLVALLGLSPGPAWPAEPRDCVVKVMASIREPDLLRPWMKQDEEKTVGTGVIIEGKQILTSAHLVLYATEVYVQAKPGSEKVEAKVKALGPDVDLALLSVDASFFDKKPALARSKKLPREQDNTAVFGFPVGGNELSVTKGVVSRIHFPSMSNRGPGVLLHISAAINPGNSGGPAVVDDKMVGIVCSRLDGAENIGYVIPNEEIDTFLADVKDGHYDGKPTEAGGTTYQHLENDALRRMLKLDKNVKGVLVHPPKRPDPAYPLKRFDVLVQVGPYEVDNEGMIQLENEQRVPFAYVIPRLARDNGVPVTVLRQGKKVQAALPVTYHNNRLIRQYGGEPVSYFIHGPLVFSPARQDALGMYFQVNPLLNAMNSPLSARLYDRVRFADEELVVVTSPLLRHKITKGYNNPIGQVVQEVNGTPIRNLRHLVEVLRDCTEEYLVFRFAEDFSQVMVFDRQEMEKATATILKDNGIAAESRGSEPMLAVWRQKPRAAR